MIRENHSTRLILAPLAPATGVAKPRESIRSRVPTRTALVLVAETLTAVRWLSIF